MTADTGTILGAIGALAGIGSMGSMLVKGGGLKGQIEAHELRIDKLEDQGTLVAITELKGKIDLLNQKVDSLAERLKVQETIETKT